MSSSDSIRVFAAVNLPTDLRGHLCETQKALKKSNAHVSWVPPDNLHVSLAFIGSIFPAKAEEISRALDEAVLNTCSFEIEIRDLGTFGKKNSPRVIWAGVYNAEPLIKLYESVKDLLSAIDIRLEDRPYKPHVTLGRVKSGRNRAELSDLLQKHEKDDFGTMRVSSIDLMKSTLLPSGAVYNILHSACLQK